MSRLEKSNETHCRANLTENGKKKEGMSKKDELKMKIGEKRKEMAGQRAKKSEKNSEGNGLKSKKAKMTKTRKSATEGEEVLTEDRDGEVDDVEGDIDMFPELSASQILNAIKQYTRSFEIKLARMIAQQNTKTVERGVNTEKEPGIQVHVQTDPIDLAAMMEEIKEEANEVDEFLDGQDVVRRKGLEPNPDEDAEESGPLTEGEDNNVEEGASTREPESDVQAKAREPIHRDTVLENVKEEVNEPGDFPQAEEVPRANQSIDVINLANQFTVLTPNILTREEQLPCDVSEALHSLGIAAGMTEIACRKEKPLRLYTKEVIYALNFTCTNRLATTIGKFIDDFKNGVKPPTGIPRFINTNGVARFLSDEDRILATLFLVFSRSLHELDSPNCFTPSGLIIPTEDGIRHVGFQGLIAEFRPVLPDAIKKLTRSGQYGVKRLLKKNGL